MLIKLFQGTNYCHYAMSYTSETGKEIYFDSTGSGGVRRSNSKQFFKNYHVVGTFEIKKNIERVDFLTFVQAYEGCHYGYRQILGLSLKMLHIIKHNPFGKGANRIICNELIILFLNWFNMTAIKDTDSIDLNETEEILLRF